jgi:hypothetical protein
MMNVVKTGSIFSFRELDQLRSQLEPNAKLLFDRHWERSLKKTFFACSPASQEKIIELQYAHVWCTIVSDILEAGYSISQLCEKTQAPATLIYDLRWGSSTQAKLPLNIAEVLLILHASVRSDLQENTLQE